MANKDIFCNIPWFELNINNDGSFDLCGCQNNKIINTALGQIWNIKSMGIDEYWNSPRMQSKRMIKLGNEVDPMCKMCQMKDQAGYTSARQKENLKSVIFHGHHFNQSFNESPHNHYFKYSKENQGKTISPIYSLHLNIGNACNFSCKFCAPEASSRVQADQKKLGWIEPGYKLEPWTQDPIAWERFVTWFNQNYKNVRVVHLIGGEPELIERFRDLLNLFHSKKMSWLNLSFTTNGSIDYSKYATQLATFKRVEIGVSIETADVSNNYLRQGADTESILKNVDTMQEQMPFVNWTFRTVPTAISVLRYTSLLKHALSRKIPIDASYPHRPKWLTAGILSNELKEYAISQLKDFASGIDADLQKFNNTKNTNNIELTLKQEAIALINHLSAPAPNDVEPLRKELALKLSQQDSLYNQSIVDYVPEIYKWIKEHGYQH